MRTLAMEKKYEYPAPANYPDVVNTDKGIEKLITKSNLEALLTKMESDGHDVSAPLVELIAMRNFIVQKMRGNKNIIPLVECILFELKK